MSHEQKSNIRCSVYHDGHIRVASWFATSMNEQIVGNINEIRGMMQTIKSLNCCIITSLHERGSRQDAKPWKRNLQSDELSPLHDLITEYGMLSLIAPCANDSVAIVRTEMVFDKDAPITSSSSCENESSSGHHARPPMPPRLPC